MMKNKYDEMFRLGIFESSVKDLVDNYPDVWMLDSVLERRTFLEVIHLIRSKLRQKGIGSQI